MSGSKSGTSARNAVATTPAIPLLERPLWWIVLAIYPLVVANAERLRVPSDDAYICYVYAQNFLAGNGFTFNGTLVEGCTTALWLLLVTAVGALVV